ncbi:MAG: acyl-CoA dehydratase activase-related protein [Bacteroidales bacterium]
MQRIENTYRIGIDVGSTTVKLVVLSSKENKRVYTSYERHHAGVRETLKAELERLKKTLPFGDKAQFRLCITGSAGIGVAERSGFTFLQEVLCSARAVNELALDNLCLIDLGGEDAKMVFFRKGKIPDIRMNGSCAGGTGAFIDQMAELMNLSPDQMSEMAMASTLSYPIASRCGVFAKTDVQNLMSRQISASDISSSIFRAVALQTVSALSKGERVKDALIFTGGPLSFLPALRRAFLQILNLDEKTVYPISDAHLFTAHGAALNVSDQSLLYSLDEIMNCLEKTGGSLSVGDLPPLFKEEEEYRNWQKHRTIKKLPFYSPVSGETISAYLGVDSGSTTTKIVVTDTENRILFLYYADNQGQPLQKVQEGLEKFYKEMSQKKVHINILSSASTGYGENLIKSAFNLDFGLVETVAHFTAARFVLPQVSFVLDIGGQDIKSIFIQDGIISNIELNESCSSGCGSFLQTFAAMMQISRNDFAELACLAPHPCDLGTRCTVFMNSKVKEALRLQLSVGDIAAGLAVSVVKNCLYKVLKISNLQNLGEGIVVQGGTFRNDAVCRALEQLSEKKVYMTDYPELMGAYGAALYAKDKVPVGSTSLSGFVGESALKSCSHIKTSDLQCKGCTNSCRVVRYQFDNGNISFAGNKCEKHFHGSGKVEKPGYNGFEMKYEALFSSKENKEKAGEKTKRIGYPRALNAYENYPFWKKLFNECGLEFILSDESTMDLFKQGAFSIMSDNVCFPAKLVHGHILNLIEKKVDRIFYPMVVLEQKQFEKDANSFNCPVVSGYADVIRSALDPAENYHIPFDKPVISFQDEASTKRTCYKYALSLGIEKKRFDRAFKQAWTYKNSFYASLKEKQQRILEKAIEEKRLLFILTGRPYHIDPLINQRTAQMISDLGVDVLTDEVLEDSKSNEMNFVSQWTYPNRVIRSAQSVALLPSNIQLIEINSFGCGPDSFLMDEAGHILKAAGKNLTVLRVDEISSPGAIRLRLRSLVASLYMKGIEGKKAKRLQNKSYKAYHAAFKKEDKRKTILIPWFTDMLSPLVPAFGKRIGYKVENLPRSDANSVQIGLKYGHNEVCYPAILVVGDIIKYLGAHKGLENNYVVGMTQTGGQCRATNYLSLIKNALSLAGYKDIPVLSLTSGSSGYQNEQSGFKVNWFKYGNLAIEVVLYTDALQQMHHSMIVREKKKGSVQAITDNFLKLGAEAVENKPAEALLDILRQAVEAYNSVEVKEEEPKCKVGLVGEIYVKYNKFAQYELTDWLESNGVEVVMPSLLPFLMEYFVNAQMDEEHGLKRESHWGKYLRGILLSYVNKRVDGAMDILKKFKHYDGFHSIFSIAQDASQILSLSNQFGEGWLIAGEVQDLVKRNIHRVVCLQPFGCIANHVVAKGIEKRLKSKVPELQMLFLDLEPGVAKVNLENRLHFLVN